MVHLNENDFVYKYMVHLNEIDFVYKYRCI